MKKNLSKSLSGMTLLLTLALTGCGGDETPGNESAYQQGSNYCSEQFVSDYRQLQEDLLTVMSESNNLDQAQSKVNDFGSKYHDVVCKAVRLDGSGEEVMVNVNDTIVSLNKGIENFRNQYSSALQSPSALPSGNPSLGSSVSHQIASIAFKGGITLQIHDESAFNPASTGYRSSMSIQNGVLKAFDDVNPGSDHCSMIYVDQDTQMSAGTQTRLILADASDLEIQFMSYNYKLIMSCKKGNGASADDLTIYDLNRILGHYATASVSQ